MGAEAELVSAGAKGPFELRTRGSSSFRGGVGVVGGGGGEGVAECFGNHLVKAQNRAGRSIPSKQEANPKLLHRRQKNLWSPGARQLKRGPGCLQVNSFVVKHRGVHAVLQGQL